MSVVYSGECAQGSRDDLALSNCFDPSFLSVATVFIKRFLPAKRQVTPMFY